jgi:uncharacterized protein
MSSKHLDKPLDPRRVDLRALVRQAETIEGQQAQFTLSRLALSVDVPEEGSEVHWSATGEWRPVSGAEPQIWLHLVANTRVQLLCQRCLQTLHETLEVERSFLFVSEEEEATRLDEELDDDVLVLPRWFNVLELVEDELILALPIVPRHEVCPDPLPMPVDEPEAASDSAVEHPFAALAALKKPPRPN